MAGRCAMVARIVVLLTHLYWVKYSAPTTNTRARIAQLGYQTRRYHSHIVSLAVHHPTTRKTAHISKLMWLMTSATTHFSPTSSPTAPSKHNFASRPHCRSALHYILWSSADLTDHSHNQQSPPTRGYAKTLIKLCQLLSSSRSLLSIFLCAARCKMLPLFGGAE